MPVSRRTREGGLCGCSVPWCDGDHSADPKLAERIAAATRGVQYLVAGSRGRTYTVRRHDVDGGWTCTCPAFGWGRGQLCKHILQIRLQEDV